MSWVRTAGAKDLREEVFMGKMLKYRDEEVPEV
jgi:hypothetical protein